MQIVQEPKILILEDDPAQQTFYLKALRQRFGSLEIQSLSTEEDFLIFLEKPFFTPLLVILGNWQRFSNDSRSYDNRSSDSENYDNLHPSLSGIRCCKALLNSELKSVPVLMYSVFDWDDYQEQIEENLPTLASDKSKFRYLTKDFNPGKLIKAIEEFVEITN